MTSAKITKQNWKQYHFFAIFVEVITSRIFTEDKALFIILLRESSQPDIAGYHQAIVSAPTIFDTIPRDKYAAVTGFAKVGIAAVYRVLAESLSRDLL